MKSIVKPAGIAAVLVLALLALFAVTKPRAPLLEVKFLGYTNSVAGMPSAIIEIRNASRTRVARNSCRIEPEGGTWYLADVRSRVLAQGEKETILLQFKREHRGPSSVRWRAVAIYVRNPTDIEYRLKECALWLKQRRLDPVRLQRWADGLTGGEASTEWIGFLTDKDS
jgi:hypothetical protein